MTVIVTWNIQACRGVDGAVDAGRIARVLQEWTADADVICLQEVSCHGAVADDDQVARLAGLFSGYTAHFGPAFDRLGPDGRRQAFGNMLLSRLPVLQVFAHPLPQPPVPNAPSMPRQATEVVVETGDGPLRVVNTHLEYTDPAFRFAQIARLRDLHAEAAQRAALKDLPGKGDYAPWPRPAEAVFCGDFNMRSDSPEFAAMLAPLGKGIPDLVDAWAVAHPDVPHAATTGVHDHKQWPQGPHCRDYLFVSRTLADRVAEVAVEGETAASDHQPVRLALR